MPTVPSLAVIRITVATVRTITKTTVVMVTLMKIAKPMRYSGNKQKGALAHPHFTKMMCISR